MTYVRVTITSQRRNVEMLLPAERHVADLMPEILRECGGSKASKVPQALSLTPIGASTLRPHQSLDDAGVGNGAVLSLDRLDEAVPRPVVYDLAEETESLEAPAASAVMIDLNRLGSTVVFAVFGLLALAAGVQVFSAATPGLWSLIASGAALLALAMIPHGIFSWDAELLAFSSGALVLTYIWERPEFPWAEWTVPAWLLIVLICWLAGRRQWHSVLITALAAFALILLWWGSDQLFTGHHEVVAVAGIGTVAMIGFAPRLALSASGMNRLDDEAAQGEHPALPRARSAFQNAHGGLVAAVLLCAVSAGIAVHGLLEGGFTRWTLPLAILITVLTAIRARSMPLAVERAALLASASISTVVILLSLIDHVPGWLLVVVAGLLALLPCLFRLRAVPHHQRAQLRIYARRLEGLATLALLPLLVGLFGIYSQLIVTFQD